MEKLVSSYETMFIIDNRLDEAATKAIVEKFTALISEHGTIETVNEWGKKRQAYPINDQNDGYYVLIDFSSSPDFISELDRVFNITEGVVRSMTIKK